VARSSPAEAVFFYTDDSRFNGLLSEPGKLKATGATSAIELNFTTSDNHPAALVIADFWRKKKLASVWQEHGIRIAVDLNISPRYLPLAFVGVPIGWKAYANRAYAADLGALDQAHVMACNHARTDKILYFVYGNQEAAALCQARGWIHIPFIHHGVNNGTPTT